MGVAAAAGSFGQFLMVPVENWLIGGLRLAGGAVRAGLRWRWLILPLAFGLRSRGAAAAHAARSRASAQALREAFAYPSFQLLMAGYFVCGFQVVFIGVHMPSYLKDQGLTPEVATTALALIGLFNVFGTYAAGVAGPAPAQALHPGGHLPLRSVAIVVFLLRAADAAGASTSSRR